MSFQLIHTQIRVEGNDEDIIFSNLFINQQLADVNSFHFTWRQPEGEASLSAHISFYNNNLSKEVTITIGDDFTFKGIIYAITCNNQDRLGVSYEINGKGLFEKLNQVPECKSFYKKNITQIFNAVNNTEGTTLSLSPKNTGELFYSVQYNQTGFGFLRMMATRYGEWLYYNGTELVLGAPAGDAITLNQGSDITNIDISAKLVKAPQNNTSFDRHTGEEMAHQPQSTHGDGFIGASQQAGETAYGTSQNMTHISAAATPQLLTDMSVLSQQAAAASAVIVRAHCNNSKIKLASKIKIIDTAGHSAGEYYITEIHHTIITDSNYQNQIVAVPAEVEVPPYTNPFLVPLCKSQPAKVVDNEDADGMDRIKVHFPWQDSSENTPWLNVVTPHAGKDKGIRFLPEVDEEVLVDFLDNNAERPFVLGAVHTEKNKSGNDSKGNNLKVIGTRTGRRIEFDDDKGIILLKDFGDSGKGNSLKLSKSDSETITKISSGTDDTHFTSLQLIEGKIAGLFLHIGGTIVAKILLSEDGKKIDIIAEGDINLDSKGNINLNASNITISASAELAMEGKSKGVSVKGLNIDVEAEKDLMAKGANTTVEGSIKADFKAGTMASLTGAIVKIN